MLKRIISMLLCVVMVFSMVPVQAFATEDVTEPTETVTEPTEETTVPTEPVTEPTEHITAPTEAATEPAQGTTAPTEETVAEEPEVIPVESVIISQAEGIAELAVGETLQLTATVLPENATDKTVVWSSSDESVATVDENGVVTAVKTGSVTITAECYNHKIHYDIYVIDFPAEDDIVLAHPYLSRTTASTYSFSTAFPNTWINTGNQAEDIVQIALTQVDYYETGNHTKYNNWFYGYDKEADWCAIFISWCANQAEIDTSIIKKNASASGFSVESMDSNPFGVPTFSFGTSTPQKGDIAYIDNNSNGTSNHVGLVYDVDSNYIYTVEGNYSEKVSTCKYSLSTGKWGSSAIVFLGRPKYEDNSLPVKKKYPCSGTLKITESCYMYTLPCNPDTEGFTSIALEDQRLLPENNPKLEVIALYENNKGSYWYEVQLKEPYPEDLPDGKTTAFVWCKKGTFTPQKPWIDGGEFPSKITGGTNMKGIVTTGNGGQLNKVWAIVNKGKGTSGTEVIQTDKHAPLSDKTKYDLYGSAVDNDIPFGTMPGDGYYTLNIYADYTCWHADGGTLTNVSNSNYHVDDFYYYFEGNKDFVIDFNANGGSCSESERTITKGDAIGSLPTPTREGLHFDGWYTELTGGSKVTANTVPDSSMTLYARWVYGDAFWLPTTDPYVFIKHRASGHGLSNVNGNVELGVYGETGSVWQFISNTDDTYTIVSAVDGTVVDIYNNDTADGTNIQTYTSNSTSAQKWYLKKIDTGYSFISANSLKAIDIYDAGTALGTNAHLYSANSSSAQIFDIEMALAGVVTPSTKTVDLVMNQNGSQTVELTYSGSSEDVKLTTSGMNGIVECSFGVFEDGKWPLTISALRAGTCTVGISAYDTSIGGYIDGCSIQVTVSVSHEGTKLNFDPNGGTISGHVLSRTYDGLNRLRGEKELIVHDIEDLYWQNEYGKEIAVSVTGKVIGFRNVYEEFDESAGDFKEFFPDGGMVISGNYYWDSSAGCDVGAAAFVDQIYEMTKQGDVYVSVDYENGLVKAFDSYAGYLSATKRVGSGSQYGILPIPVRSGYVFNGWQINGSNVNYFSTYADESLTASWSAESSLTPNDTMEYNGHTYERYDSIVTWEKAKQICEAKGGHLVVITDAAENAAVTSLATKGIRGLYSIGLTDKDSVGTWKWVTGETFSYDNWDPQYPEPEYEPEKNYGILVAIDNPPNKQVGEWLNTFNEFHSESLGEQFYDQSNVGFICEYEGPASCSHSYNAVVTKPTCTAQGYTTHTCSKCGDSYVDTYVAATGHSYSYTVSKAPTTDATGTLKGTCSKCSGTTTVTLPKLDTTNYSYTITKTETCTADGSGRYTWNTTTYGSFYFDVVRAKLGHSYTSKVTAPTCTAQGYTTHTCSRCSDSYVDTYVAATDHKWNSGEVTTTATCTKDGVKTYTCTACSATKTEVITSLGHSYNAVVTAPTCTEKGYTTHTCSRCSDSYVDTYVAATDHKWNSGEVTTAATCTKDGMKTYTCTVCSVTKTEVITSLGHSYNAVVTAPTCTEQGYTTHTCVCGDSYVDSYVDALNHDFESGKCTRCNTVDPDYKKGSCGENLTWVLDENGILTISGTGAMSEFTSSSQPWAEYMDDIFRVIVEDGVTTVSQYAFFKCSNLETVKISDTVTDIGIWAFAYCSSLRNADIGEGVTIIQTRVFSDCTALTELTIGSNVTRIMQWPFADCTSLKSIVLPETLTRIDAYAFQNCSSLTDVTLPAALDTFSYGVFGGCSSLSNINVAEDNASFCSVDGVVYNKNKTRIVEVPGGRTGKFIIPDSVTSIGEYAFYECRFITEIIIPDSVRLLNSHAFHGCDGLTQIIIPESVYGVYVGAFSYCSNLKEIEFLGNAPSFRVDVFKNVTATVYYPANNTTWTEDVRQQYSGTIIWESYDPCVKNGHDYKDLVTEPDCSEKGYTTHTCSVCGDSYVDSFVDALGHNYVDGVCSSCGEEDPNAVTVIDSGTCGESAYWTLYSDGKLVISGTGELTASTSIQDVPWYNYCSTITNVDIEEGITGANMRYCFSKCNSLVEISIPSSLTVFGIWAFKDTKNIEKVQITDLESWCAIDFKQEDSNPMHKGAALYINGVAAEEITIPKTVSKIMPYVFVGCNSITNVTISHGVEQIGAFAFKKCTALESIDIPDSVQKIDGYAFAYSKALKSVVIPEGVETIAGSTFTGCTKLREVTLPSTLTRIENDAFNSCESLGKCDIPSGVTYIGDNAFWNCYYLKNVTIPAGVKEIGKSVFSGCWFMENLIISEGVEVIGEGAFSHCREITNVVIPSTVHTIRSSAFSSCYDLVSIVIPENVVKLESSVFSACEKLENVEIKGNLNEIGDSVFYSCVALNTVKFYGNAPIFGDTTFKNAAATVYYPTNNPTWTEDVMQDYGGTITWMPYGAVENRVAVPSADLEGQTTVWIDGVEYVVLTDGELSYVDLPESDATNMITYTWHEGDSSDIHTKYPVSMKVWRLSNEDGIYTATHVEELDDILQYSGSSIRVTGKQGIRMITSIEREKKAALISDGLAGYTLKEYGTVVAWASQMGENPLVLGKSYAKSNYAYKQGKADPVFAYDGSLMQYTNVLIGFSLAQCKNDLAMRPYMILEDAEGNEITLYGGLVTRSIGYIAYLNRAEFDPGTDAYKYVWDIIHSVYGDAYDAEYVA